MFSSVVELHYNEILLSVFFPKQFTDGTRVMSIPRSLSTRTLKIVAGRNKCGDTLPKKKNKFSVI
jgi:hypothetical protein